MLYIFIFNNNCTVINKFKIEQLIENSEKEKLQDFKSYFIHLRRWLD